MRGKRDEETHRSGIGWILSAPLATESWGVHAPRIGRIAVRGSTRVAELTKTLLLGRAWKRRRRRKSKLRRLLIALQRICKNIKHQELREESAQKTHRIRSRLRGSRRAHDSEILDVAPLENNVFIELVSRRHWIFRAPVFGTEGAHYETRSWKDKCHRVHDVARTIREGDRGFLGINRVKSALVSHAALRDERNTGIDVGDRTTGTHPNTAARIQIRAMWFLSLSNEENSRCQWTSPEEGCQVFESR